MAKLEQEAHRLSGRALEQQERALSELRARAGTLFTVSALVASFLGGQVLERGTLGPWVILALIAFGVSIVSCIYVLLPKDDLILALDGPEAYEALYGFRHDKEELDRRLAYWLRSFREANHQVLERSNRAFEIAGFSLLFEIGFWALELVLD
jgi:hypothetical protein